jgi:hypothetical protein
MAVLLPDTWWVWFFGVVAFHLLIYIGTYTIFEFNQLKNAAMFKRWRMWMRGSTRSTFYQIWFWLLAFHSVALGLAVNMTTDPTIALPGNLDWFDTLISFQVLFVVFCVYYSATAFRYHPKAAAAKRHQNRWYLVVLTFIVFGIAVMELVSSAWLVARAGYPTTQLEYAFLCIMLSSAVVETAWMLIAFLATVASAVQQGPEYTELFQITFRDYISSIKSVQLPGGNAYVQMTNLQGVGRYATATPAVLSPNLVALNAYFRGDAVKPHTN